MHVHCRQLTPKSEERRGQGEACPASLKLTNQINCCSFPSLSERLRGRAAQHTTLVQIPSHGRKQQERGRDVLSRVPDSAGHEQNQSGPGRNPEIGVLIH